MSASFQAELNRIVSSKTLSREKKNLLIDKAEKRRTEHNKNVFKLIVSVFASIGIGCAYFYIS